tara:strand:+ start:831 stop:1265 length:435 start_codon:yes stop_codon:yes gene_type:complete
MIKLKELLKESFYVALVSKPRTGNFNKPVGNFKLMSKGRAAGLAAQSAEKILKSEIGRNLSREAAENAKVVATYDEKGVHHGRINMGPRRFVSAIAAEVDIEERKFGMNISNKSIQVTKNMDMVIGKTQKDVEKMLKNKYKVKV